MSDEILEAKRILYSLLVKKSIDKITENELDIMMLLSKDEQIKLLFKSH